MSKFDDFHASKGLEFNVYTCWLEEASTSKKYRRGENGLEEERRFQHVNIRAKKTS